MQSSVTALKFDRTEEKILCGNQGGTVMLFDLNETRCINNWAAHQSAVNSLFYHPQNEKLVLSCGYDGKMKIFAQNQRTAIQAYQAHNGPANCVCCSPDGKYVATGGNDKTIRFFDIVAQRQIAKLEAHTDAVTCVAFHPTDPILMSGSADRSIRFFDLETMKEISVSFPLDSSPIDLITFVQNENVALSASPDYLKVVGWSPPEFFDLFTLGLEKVHDISISDRVATIASSSGDRCIIHSLRLDQLKPLSNRPVRSRPSTPRLLDIESIKKTPSVISNKSSSDQIPQKPSSKKSTRLLKTTDTNKSNESKVFQIFRQERSQFMLSMNDKYSRLTRIKDLIQQVGLSKTLEAVSESGDLGVELLILLRMKPEVVKFNHSSLIMQIAVRVFDRDPDLAITTIESMLQAFGKLVIATRQISSNDPAMQNRKKQSELFVESFKEVAPKLKNIAMSNSPSGQTASSIIDEWKIFLR